MPDQGRRAQSSVRQYASYASNANGLKITSNDELCRKFPPPEWMREKAVKMWCDTIRSYAEGQFKRGNMPILEHYCIVYLNLQKLMRRLGFTGGLVRQIPEFEGDQIVMTTKISSELRLYKSLLLALMQLHNQLHLPPRPYLMSTHGSAGNFETDAEVMQDNEQDTGRMSLIGGRKEARKAA